MTKTITIITTNTNCNENNFNIIENLNNRRLILCVSFFHYNHYNCVRSTATFLCQETLSVKRRPHLVPPLTCINLSDTIFHFISIADLYCQIVVIHRFACRRLTTIVDKYRTVASPSMVRIASPLRWRYR